MTNMMKSKKVQALFLVLVNLCMIAPAPITAAVPKSIQTFPSLPLQSRENHFQSVEKGFEERANLFLKGKQFHNWRPNKPIAEIKEEFKQIQEWRNHAWYSDITNQYLVSRTDFMVAQSLLERGHFLRPHLIAFQYNVTDPNYNSSTIVLNGQRFLALEAPRPNMVPHFFRLLQNHLVTQVVRLTPSTENGYFKSSPYWESRTQENPKAPEKFLVLPRDRKSEGQEQGYKIRYYAIDSWRDNRGVSPKILLNLIQEVRQHYDSKGLLACHCAAGVGRTGTFIAAFLLVQEVDRQLAAGVPVDALDVSIEKVVMQLSLQRPHMVAREAQYETLYRLLDTYIQDLKGIN